MIDPPSPFFLPGQGGTMRSSGHVPGHKTQDQRACPSPLRKHHGPANNRMQISIPERGNINLTPSGFEAPPSKLGRAEAGGACRRAAFKLSDSYTWNRLCRDACVLQRGLNLHRNIIQYSSRTVILVIGSSNRNRPLRAPIFIYKTDVICFWRPQKNSETLPAQFQWSNTGHLGVLILLLCQLSLFRTDARRHVLLAGCAPELPKALQITDYQSLLLQKFLSGLHLAAVAWLLDCRMCSGKG